MKLFEIKILMDSSFSEDTLKNLVTSALNQNGLYFKEIHMNKFNMEGPKKKRNLQGRPNKYPFREMRVGDQYVFSTKYTRYLMNLACSAARNWAKKSGNCTDRKFRVHKGEFNNVIITRVK